MDGGMEDSVTVVVATRNRRDALLSTLPHHEAPVIVVDNGSTDGTAEAVRSAFPSVSVLPLRHNLGGAGRNAGVRRATTPLVAFVDDDSYWSPGALRHAASVLDRHPRAALLAARVLVGDDRRLDPVSAAMAEAPLGTPADLPGPSVLGFLACAAVVRREVFLGAGGFSPLLHTYGEETLLALDLAAAGWGLAYVPELVVRHFPATGRGPRRDRLRREARNRLLTTWLRRRPGVVLRETARAATAGPDQRAGLLSALAALPYVLRHRHRLPERVEAAARRLEG